LGGIGIKMFGEVFEKCYFCHAELRLGISETIIHGYPKYEYVVKHEPHLACTKCNNQFQAEPYQYEKISVFMKFLKSIGLKKAEIEYNDLIRYVDQALNFKCDN